jgi:Flp pilus assembly protein TadB
MNRPNLRRPWHSVLTWARRVSRVELAMVLWAIVMLIGFLITIGFVIGGVHQLWVVWLLMLFIAGTLPSRFYFQFRDIRRRKKS